MALPSSARPRALIPAGSTGTRAAGAGTASFLVTGTLPDGSISAGFSHQFDYNNDVDGNPNNLFLNENTASTFADTYTFTIPAPLNGTGSGQFSTIAGISVKFDINFGQNAGDVFFNNGVSSFNVPVTANGNLEGGGLSGIPIFFGNLNTLYISGTTHGTANYAGTLNFSPAAIPEAATWAMMVIGLGGIGGSMRYRRRKSATAVNLRTIAYS